MDIDGKKIECIIADGILSKVVKKRGNVFRVINHGETSISYLIKNDDIFAHGASLKDAKESLKYKISSRDVSAFEKYTLDDELDLITLIRAYRAITGACELGTRYFCEKHKLPEKMTVREAVELTEGQYNHELFKKFFEGRKNGN